MAIIFASLPRNIDFMFDWFKKKPQLRDPEVEAFAKRLLGPSALVTALAETIRHYFNEVRAGRIEYPAHKRKNDSIVGIWRDLRLESLANLLSFGRADVMLLAEHRSQLALLRCLLDERPHLEMPQPHGEIIPDTIQAIWQVYVYLGKVGSEVADRETDQYALRVAKRDILSALTSRAETLRVEWEDFQRAVESPNSALPSMPGTLFEEIYTDVTAKAKSIALSAQFGPNYESNMSYLEEEVRKRGGDIERVKGTRVRIMAALDPDEFSKG
jgi:hypothetical protein